jgi:hypothetical protein
VPSSVHVIFPGPFDGTSLSIGSKHLSKRQLSKMRGGDGSISALQVIPTKSVPPRLRYLLKVYLNDEIKGECVVHLHPSDFSNSEEARSFSCELLNQGLPLLSPDNDAPLHVRFKLLLKATVNWK